jgi:predicted rRNA methylase YqxC with S4 and FtsJ domains
VRALARFFKWAIMEQDFHLLKMTASPVEGADGNREFLILMKPAS